MSIHIGKEIEKVAKARGISNAEFGRRLKTSDTNIRNIFTRESLDTYKLLEIGKILEFDFSSLLRPGNVSEPTGEYTNLDECRRENVKLLRENNKLMEQLVELQGKYIKMQERTHGL